MDAAEIAFAFAIMALFAVTALAVGVKKQLKLSEINRIRYEASNITGSIINETANDFKKKLFSLAKANQDYGFVVYNRNGALSVGLFCDVGILAPISELCLDSYTGVEPGYSLNIYVVNQLGNKMLEFEEAATPRFVRLTDDFIPQGPIKMLPLCNFMGRCVRECPVPERYIKGDMLPDLQKSVIGDACPEASKPSICDDVEPVNDSTIAANPAGFLKIAEGCSQLKYSN